MMHDAASGAERAVVAHQARPVPPLGIMAGEGGRWISQLGGPVGRWRPGPAGGLENEPEN
jgi:hypothetical protein